MIASPWRAKFNAAAQTEPNLFCLYLEVLGIGEMAKSIPDFDTNAAWFGYRGWPGIKPRLTRLVGWSREGGGPDELFTSEAYDAAYQWLYENMPDCGPMLGDPDYQPDAEDDDE